MRAVLAAMLVASRRFGGDASEPVDVAESPRNYFYYRNINY